MQTSTRMLQREQQAAAVAMDCVNAIDITVDKLQLRPTLRALLYAIFFHRTLTPVEAQTFAFADTHVACAPNKAIDEEIESKVEAFYQGFGTRASCQIAVVLQQKRPKKTWFSVVEQDVPWEEHLITVHLSPKPPTNQLPEALLKLLTFCSERAAYVPALVGGSPETSPFTHSVRLFAQLSQPTDKQQMMINPPPPSELFDPPSSPPLSPEPAFPPRARSQSPNPSMGYLDQVKGGVKAVGQGVGWGGRAVNAAFGGRG